MTLTLLDSHTPLTSDTDARERPLRVRRASGRTQYSEAVKQQVLLRYPACRTLQDKEDLAAELGIESLQKLYNLASRLRATSRAATESGTDLAHRMYEEATDAERRLIREIPEETEFTETDDEHLRRHFGSQPIEVIAFARHHTEIAMAYRARQLGLRKAARYWDLNRVLDWLGIEAPDLKKMGVPIHPCADDRGRVRINLVSTMDLARALSRNMLWKRLIDIAHSDRFFIREIIESAAVGLTDESVWEQSLWMSHGHTCLNPLSRVAFNFFYAGSDPKALGDTASVEDLHPRRVHLMLY